MAKRIITRCLVCQERLLLKKSLPPRTDLRKISSRCQHEEWYRYNQKMQQILEAYRILSDPKKRASYDRKVFGKPSAGADRNFDLFNLHNMEETAPVTGTPFVNYWRAR